MGAGRPTKYDKSIIDRSNEYLDLCIDETKQVVVQESEKYTMYKDKLVVKLPTIEGLAAFIGISRETVYDWESKYEEFSDIIRQLRGRQLESLINNGLSGDYNPTIAKVLLSKHGYSEKQEIEHSGLNLTVKKTIVK